MVPQELIGSVIGPGGKTIKSIIALTDCEINIDDDGQVTVAGVDRQKVDRAIAMVSNLVKQVEVGEEFEGEVKRLMAFGAFVEVLPGKEGLVHVSKMGSGFVKDPADVVSVGDKVGVRVHEIDDQGRINLTMTRLPDGTTVTVKEDSNYRRDDNARSDRGFDRGSKRFDDRRSGRFGDRRSGRRDERRRY
jgi:polyribonucleotide nucleotidyltransferase